MIVNKIMSLYVSPFYFPSQKSCDAVNIKSNSRFKASRIIFFIFWIIYNKNIISGKHCSRIKMIVAWFETPCRYEKARICQLAVCEFCRVVWIQYWGKCNRKEQRKQPQRHSRRVWDEEGSAKRSCPTRHDDRNNARDTLDRTRASGGVHRTLWYLPNRGPTSPYTRVAPCIGYLLNCVRLRPGTTDRLPWLSFAQEMSRYRFRTDGERGMTEKNNAFYWRDKRLIFIKINYRHNIFKREEKIISSENIGK